MKIRFNAIICAVLILKCFEPTACLSFCGIRPASRVPLAYNNSAASLGDAILKASENPAFKLPVLITVRYEGRKPLYVDFTSAINFRPHAKANRDWLIRFFIKSKYHSTYDTRYMTIHTTTPRHRKASRRLRAFRTAIKKILPTRRLHFPMVVRIDENSKMDNVIFDYPVGGYDSSFFIAVGKDGHVVRVIPCL